MEVLGITIAVLIGLFFLAVVSFIVFVAVQVFKGHRRVKSAREDFYKRFDKDWDRRPPRSYR